MIELFQLLLLKHVLFYLSRRKILLIAFWMLWLNEMIILGGISVWSNEDSWHSSEASFYGSCKLRWNNTGSSQHKMMIDGKARHFSGLIGERWSSGVFALYVWHGVVYLLMLLICTCSTLTFHKTASEANTSSLFLCEHVMVSRDAYFLVIFLHDSSIMLFYDVKYEADTSCLWVLEYHELSCERDWTINLACGIF